MYINMFKAAPGMWLWRLVWHTHQALRSNAQLLAAVGAVLAALVLTDILVLQANSNRQLAGESNQFYADCI